MLSTLFHDDLPNLDAVKEAHALFYIPGKYDEEVVESMIVGCRAKIHDPTVSKGTNFLVSWKKVCPQLFTAPHHIYTSHVLSPSSLVSGLGDIGDRFRTTS